MLLKCPEWNKESGSCLQQGLVMSLQRTNAEHARRTRKGLNGLLSRPHHSGEVQRHAVFGGSAGLLCGSHAARQGTKHEGQVLRKSEGLDGRRRRHGGRACHAAPVEQRRTRHKWELALVDKARCVDNLHYIACKAHGLSKHRCKARVLCREKPKPMPTLAAPAPLTPAWRAAQSRSATPCHRP